MDSRKRKRHSEESGYSAEDNVIDRPVGFVSGQVIVSQQDYDSEWVRIDWPPTRRVDIECLNPSCTSQGFDWERLESAIAQALEHGSAVAGSLRCTGMDMVSMSRCTNALVYLWDGEEA
ncbi:MAG: hypothetical protein C4318_00060 [Acidimicrobiia bacterium]